MISYKHRFHGRGSLARVYQNGATVRGPLFSVKSLLNPRRANYRLAVVVSRKVSKSAVIRNRIRRQLYEAVRRQEANIKEPHDIVITVFDDKLLNASPILLDNQLKNQLSRAGILVKIIKS